MPRRTFVPAVVPLEARQLLAIAPTPPPDPSDFASFGVPIAGVAPVLDPADPTGHRAFAVAGLPLEADVRVPDNCVDIQSVTFRSANIVNPNDGTAYWDLPTWFDHMTPPAGGDYTTTKTWVDAAGNPATTDGPVEFEFREGLALGDYDISITVVARCWAPGPGPRQLQLVPETLTSVLHVRNEAPTVRTLAVTVPSVGFDFRGADGDTSQGETGTAWLHLNRGPDDNHGGLPRGQATYTTTVVNTTHYTLDLGLVQQVRGRWSLLYDNGATTWDEYGPGASVALDTARQHPNNPSLLDDAGRWFYQDKSMALAPGAAGTLGTPVDPIADSPAFSAPLADRGGHLLQIEMDLNYQTSVLAKAVLVPGNAAGTRTVAINTLSLLDTTAWHLFDLGEMGWDPTDYGDGPELWNLVANNGPGYMTGPITQYADDTFTADAFANQSWASWVGNVQDAVAAAGLAAVAATPPAGPSRPATPSRGDHDRGVPVAEPGRPSQHGVRRPQLCQLRPAQRGRLLRPADAVGPDVRG